MKKYQLVYVSNNKILGVYITGNIKLCQWKKNQLTKPAYGEYKILSVESIKYNYK